MRIFKLITKIEKQIDKNYHKITCEFLISTVIRAISHLKGHVFISVKMPAIIRKIREIVSCYWEFA